MRNEYSWALDTDYLSHHGIKGQKWGVRRYQNEDGTLTAAGRARIQTDSKFLKKYKKEILATRKRADKTTKKMRKNATVVNSPVGNYVIYKNKDKGKKLENELLVDTIKELIMTQELRDLKIDTSDLDAAANKVKDKKV